MCPLGISGGMIRNTENPKAGKIDLDIFYLKVALARWCAVSGTPRQKAQIGISTVDAAAASRTSYSFMWLKRWENAWRHGDANKKMAAEEQKELMEMSSRHFCPASCQMWRCWSLETGSVVITRLICWHCLRPNDRQERGCHHNLACVFYAKKQLRNKTKFQCHSNSVNKRKLPRVTTAFADSRCPSERRNWERNATAWDGSGRLGRGMCVRWSALNKIFV